MPTSKSWAASVERKLRSLKRTKFPPGNYHGTPHEYLGLNTAQLRALSRELDKDLSSWRDNVKALWKLPIYEAQGIAVSISVRRKKEFQKSDWPLFCKWLSESEGWAMIDGLTCDLLAPLITTYPALAQKTRAWSRSKNLWLRRASLTTFCRPVRTGQFADLGFMHADRLASDRDPMVYKALSWFLRESIKHDRRRVEKFLKDYEHELHPLVLREVRTKLRTGKKNG